MRYSPITLGSIVRERRAGAFRITEVVHQPHTILPSHAHENPNLVGILAGTGIESTECGAWQCAPGNIVIKPPGFRHGNRVDAAGMRTIIAELDRPLPEFIPAMREPLRLARSPLPGTFSALATELRASDAATPVMMEGRVLLLLGTLLRSAGRKESRRPAWLTGSRDALHDDVASGKSIAELARDAGVHPVHFIRTFRRFFGVTPGTYLRRLRIERACELLITTSHPVARIAMETGFADQSHFARMFTQVTGVSPSAYRAQKKRTRS